MSEVERLEAYYPFSDEILETVAEVADVTRTYETWDELSLQARKDHAISHTIFKPLGVNKPAEVLAIRAHDEKDVLGYHLPMGNGIDPNMMTRLYVLANCLPNTTIIATNNPGSPGNNLGKIDISRFNEVRHGNLRATVEPMIQYAAREDFETMSHVGYSYGADRAAAAVEHSYVPADRLVAIETASAQRRNVGKLAMAFSSTAKHLKGYVEASDSTAYNDARNLADKQNLWMPGYVLGLLRASNIAISSALGKGMFEERMDAALTAQEDLKASIIWGTASELANDDLLEILAVRLRDKFGKERVHKDVIEGQHHAMVEDIFLHSAFVLHGLEQTTTKQ